MPATIVNLNGINELDLNLAGTVTATTAAGVTTINQTGVTGLELEVNGTPNADQALLNLVPGANVTITDGGSGNITIAASGGSGTVTAVTGTAPITSTGGTTPVIAVDTATTSALGVVQPDGTTIGISSGTISAIGAPPTGMAGGDLSGTYPNPTVNQIEGAAIPASAAFVGTNSSKQLIAATAVTAVTGNAPITSTGGTTPAISVGTATTGALGVVRPDGSTIVISGGVISAAASSILFYGDSTATALGGENTVTIGSTPIAGSIDLFLNGILVSSSYYSISTNVITLTNNFGVGDSVRAKWTTTNSTPGNIGLTAGGGYGVRGYTVTSNPSSGGTVMTLTFPAGSVAGDLCIVTFGWSQGSLPSTPSGWTLLDGSSGSGTFWGGGTYSKILTSGDVAAGSVTFGGPNAWTAAIITLIGNTYGVVGTPTSSRSQSSPASLTTSTGSPVVGNTAFLFGSQGQTTTGATTWAPGTLLATGGDTVTDSCALYKYALAANGPVTATASYVSSTGHNFQTIIVINFPSTAPGTIPEISQSQISGFPAVADTGTANAYAVATSPAFGLVKGAFISFIAGNANTGASTLSVNAGSAIAIKANGNTAALLAGAITAGQVIDVTYDGTVWQMIVPSGISLTTTGTSGAATLSSGVLNIPVYSGGGGGALILLGTASASSSSFLTFTSVLSGSYDNYLIECLNLVCGTNAVALLCQFSTNNGSTWDTTTADYIGGSLYAREDAAGNGANSGKTGLAGAYLTDSYGTAQPGITGEIKLYNSSSAVYRQMVYQMTGIGSGNSGYYVQAGGAMWLSTTQANAIRFFVSSGNITSGTIRIYGITP